MPRSKAVSISLYERFRARSFGDNKTSLDELLKAARDDDPLAFKAALLSGARLQAHNSIKRKGALALEAAINAPRHGPEMLLMLRSLGASLSDPLPHPKIGETLPFEIAARVGSIASCALLAKIFKEEQVKNGYDAFNLLDATTHQRQIAGAWVAHWAGRYRKNALVRGYEIDDASATIERDAVAALSALSLGASDFESIQEKGLVIQSYRSDELPPAGPLVKAAVPCLGAMKALITAGADIDEADSERGATALHKACSLLDPRSVDLLLSSGADPSLENARGSSPLLVALSAACAPGPDAPIGSPLTKARSKALGEISLLLINAGAYPEGDITATNPEARALLGLSPLVISADPLGAHEAAEALSSMIASQPPSPSASLPQTFAIGPSAEPPSVFINCAFESSDSHGAIHKPEPSESPLLTGKQSAPRPSLGIKKRRQPPEPNNAGSSKPKLRF